MCRIFCFLFLINIISCTSTKEVEYIHLSGIAQGTTYNISYENVVQRNLKNEIDSILDAFDMSLSNYKEASIISRFNRNDSLVKSDELFDYFFEKSIEISEKTDGAFDITIAPLVNAWGFGFRTKQKIEESLIDSLKELVDYKKVNLIDGKLIKQDERMLIIGNAIAQGYSVDVIAKYFDSLKIDNYLVEVGGEVKAKGLNPNKQLWKIGIDMPIDTLTQRKLHSVIELKDLSVATSGNYRKFYIDKDNIKYSHTVDPNTGYPVKHSLLSATVITQNCIDADAYATAFMVWGVDKTKSFLSDNPEIQAFLIFDTTEGLQTFISDSLQGMIHFVEN